MDCCKKKGESSNEHCCRNDPARTPREDCCKNKTGTTDAKEHDCARQDAAPRRTV